MDQVTIPIPPDEALLNAYTKEKECLHADRLRAVATLAAKQAAEQAAEQAVKRTIDDIERWALMNGPRQLVDMLRKHYPTPPKEQQPVTDTLGRKLWSSETGSLPTPSPDPATVRVCIERLQPLRFNADGRESGGVAESISALESLLPKPTPAPEPERYVTVEEVADAMKDVGGTLVASRCAVLSRLDKHAAKRGPMITPEQAYNATARVCGWAIDDNYWRDKSLAALHLAAKQGGGE